MVRTKPTDKARTTGSKVPLVRSRFIDLAYESDGDCRPPTSRVLPKTVLVLRMGCDKCADEVPEMDGYGRFDTSVVVPTTDQSGGTTRSKPSEDDAKEDKTHATLIIKVLSEALGRTVKFLDDPDGDLHLVMPKEKAKPVLQEANTGPPAMDDDEDKKEEEESEEEDEEEDYDDEALYEFTEHDGAAVVAEALREYAFGHGLCLHWVYKDMDSVAPDDTDESACYWSCDSAAQLRDGRQAHLDYVREHGQDMMDSLEEALGDWFNGFAESNASTVGTQQAISHMPYFLHLYQQVHGAWKPAPARASASSKASEACKDACREREPRHEYAQGKEHKAPQPRKRSRSRSPSPSRAR